MDVYPFSGQEDHPRRFQVYWFRTFPWLDTHQKNMLFFALHAIIF